MPPHYPTQYFVEYDNPYNVSMSGMFDQPAGCHAILNCDVPLTLGCDFAWNQFQCPADPRGAPHNAANFWGRTLASAE
jgi:thiamine pyrophosphate-dependent acetolactate synthase large subunit-like protein